MLYFSEEEIIAQGWANVAQLQRMRDKALSVVMCKDCRFKESEDCPFCYIENDPFVGEDYVLSYPDEDNYCKFGKEQRRHFH